MNVEGGKIEDSTGIYSQGMTLFRKEFTLTQADIDSIVAAESQPDGGLFMDMVADDFYDLYINGTYIHSNAINSTNADASTHSNVDAQNKIRFQLQIKASMLKLGVNLIAVSVMDNIGSNYNFIKKQDGIGLGFAMVLNVPKGYTLSPSTTCDKAYAIPGGAVTCTHAVSKISIDPLEPLVNPTTYTVSCSVEKLSNGSMLSTAAVDAAIPGCSSASTIVVSLADVLRSFTVPVSWSSDSYRICTKIIYDPKGRNAEGTTIAGSVESTPTCVLIATRPYLTIVGGNLWAGGSITSPYTGIAKVTASPPSTFGSFGDYGVFATDEIDYFGSAGQLGKASSTSGMVDGTRLTFANKKDPSATTPNLGSYTDKHEIKNLVTDYASAGHTAAVLFPPGLGVGVQHRVVGSGVYSKTTPGELKLAGNDIAPGVHAVIYVPNGTVSIEGNITYGTTTGVSSFAQVPSLTIVAKRIQINGTVTEIAGNFYASDSFVTCYQGPVAPGASAAITSNPGAACNHRLDIHGAVTVANQATNSLVFNRSYGGTTAGDPAEVIQMRPEVFLTAYDLSAQSGNMTMTTVQETSLPPRY